MSERFCVAKTRAGPASVAERFPRLTALKSYRRVLRRAEAPHVRSKLSLPPLPIIRHRRRSAPSPQRCTSVVCFVCYKSGKITNLIHFAPSHCNFPSIYTSISPPVSIAMLCLPWLSACSPQTQLFIFGEHSPNPFLFAKFKFIKQNKSIYSIS